LTASGHYSLSFRPTRRKNKLAGHYRLAFRPFKRTACSEQAEHLLQKPVYKILAIISY